MSFFAKLFSKASIKPRQRSGATVRFLCKAFFLAKESGEGRDTAFPSPQTPLPQEPSRDCCGALGSSIKLLRLRSRGECLWHSFRSLAAYCSSSAHPRNICCVGFARMEMLAKYIRMRTARSHPRGARTRALNVPRRASTNIGNSCYVKRKRGALEKSWLILKNVILYEKATTLLDSVLQTVIH